MDLWNKFFSWHKLKYSLQLSVERPYFKEREIWFLACGSNVGFEQNGTGKNFDRPVLVVKKFNYQVFWGIPLTKTIRENPYYYTFSYKKNLLSSAILSQLRLYDSKRLIKKDGMLNKADFIMIKAKIRNLL